MDIYKLIFQLALYFSVCLKIFYFLIAVYNDLYATGLFENMSLDTDEEEHSIEMQLPFIAKVLER